MRSHSWLVSLSHLKQLVVDYVGKFLILIPLDWNYYIHAVCTNQLKVSFLNLGHFNCYLP